METVLIQCSSDNKTWTNLPVPASYKLSYEDIDNDSYRSVATGNLIRRRISPRWIKLEIEYPYLTDAQVNTIAKAVNTNQTFYCKVKSPAFGNTGTDNTWTSFKAYVSEYEVEFLEMQLGYTMSFAIVQASTGGHQS